LIFLLARYASRFTNDGQAERERHPEHPNAELWKGSPTTALPQPANTTQNVPMPSASNRFVLGINFS